MFPRLKERERNLGTNLSGGEQQMLAIGRALMTNPLLLILDEATEGLAPLIRAEIWRCLERLKDAGLSILVIDKDVGPLLNLADRHYMLEKGRVVWQGRSDELRAQPEVLHRYRGRLRGARHDSRSRGHPHRTRPAGRLRRGHPARPDDRDQPAQGFKGWKVNKGVESPERYLLMIFWDTLEDHTVAFRGGPLFAEWRAIVGPFFAAPPVVEHFTLLGKSRLSMSRDAALPAARRAFRQRRLRARPGTARRHPQREPGPGRRPRRCAPTSSRRDEPHRSARWASTAGVFDNPLQGTGCGPFLIATRHEDAACPPC